MDEFRLDWERAERCGTSEAVLCEPKSAAQIDAIVAHASELDRRLLLTRLGPRKFARLSADVRDALDYDEATRTAILGGLPASSGIGRVAIVCGGTSDLAVAGEALRTLAFAGEKATLLADVGVAGLWRLMERLPEIRRHRVVIAIAGMEGALFSVLAGLVPCAVIAVPTSVGYGVSKGGPDGVERGARELVRRASRWSTSTMASARRTRRCEYSGVEAPATDTASKRVRELSV
jgi:NCAIR mutase (PurE)-related protein